jgi:hypothetical protein
MSKRDKHRGLKPISRSVEKTLTAASHNYRKSGEYPKKIERLEKLLATQEKHYGVHHIKVARTLVKLSDAYGHKGDLQKELKLLECAVAVEEKYYGRYHIELARDLANLGNSYVDAGKHKHGLALLNRALAIKKEYYGDHHIETVSTLLSLSYVYGGLRQFGKEHELLERALEIQITHYGKRHSEVAKTAVDLGVFYQNLGYLQASYQMLKFARPILEKYYGLNHPCMQFILNMLSAVYRHLNGYTQSGTLAIEKKARQQVEAALKQLNNLRIMPNKETIPNEVEKKLTALEGQGNRLWQSGDNPSQDELFFHQVEQFCQTVNQFGIELLYTLEKDSERESREKEPIVSKITVSSITRSPSLTTSMASSTMAPHSALFSGVVYSKRCSENTILKMQVNMGV